MILEGLPTLAVAALIFSLRVVDVCLGTIRTISVMRGRIRLSVLLGFFEVILWVTAVSQVIARVQDSPGLILAYAGGFATGNALGIMIERRMPGGLAVVRMLSDHSAAELASRLRSFALDVTTFAGTSDQGSRTLLYVTCARRNVRPLVAEARRVDPALFYVIERFSQTSPVGPLPDPTGWRAVFKKK
jgi:uncharacterized protein YebE (UPF0316 family)